MSSARNPTITTAAICAWHSLSIAHQRQQLTPTEAILNSVSQYGGPQSPSLLWGLLQNYHNTSPKPTSFIQTYNTPLQVSRQNATPLWDVQHSHVALRPKLAAHVSPLCWLAKHTVPLSQPALTKHKHVAACGKVTRYNISASSCQHFAVPVQELLVHVEQHHRRFSFMMQQGLGKHSEKNSFSCSLGSSLACTFVRIWLLKATSSSSEAELGQVRKG